ncbi:MAG TPA: hypothetical protein PKO41_03750 [Dokdonella sp.]|nr:hypothetical protein [Dokdonella sp.]
MRAYLALAAVALALGVVWYAYATGRDHGRAACEADQARAAESARTAADESARAAASTHTATQSWLWQALPPIDLRTTEARERVRIVYREAAALPAADRCSAPARPVRVQQELDQARDRAAAAARGEMRSGPG